MNKKKLAELTDEELLLEAKRIKPTNIYDAVIFGVLVGIAIYSAVKNGFEFFTFFPLILAYIIIRNSTNNKILEKEINKELQSRNLK